MSDTPKTDALIAGLVTWPQPEDILEHAKNVEQQLSELVDGRRVIVPKNEIHANAMLAVTGFAREAPLATTYTKSYRPGGYFDNNPLEFITVMSGGTAVATLPRELLQVLVNDLVRHEDVLPGATAL